MREIAAAAAALTLIVRGLIAQTLHTPDFGVDDDGIVSRLHLDAARVDSLSFRGAGFELDGFPLPGGDSVDLRLQAFSVLAPGASVVVGGPGGDVEIGAPSVSLFRGSVEGDPRSRVFLALTTGHVNGFVEHAGRTYVISSGPHRAGLPPVIAAAEAFAGRTGEFAWRCGVAPDLGDARRGPHDAGPRDASATSSGCRIARVAIETDYEFTARRFGGDADAAAAYAVTLLGAVSEIYARDLDVRLVVPFLRVWDEDVDPYDGGDLNAFQVEWNSTMSHVEREAAHLLSGRYNGGAAWVGTLCDPSVAYGVTGVDGSFPYPLRDHDSGNWDVVGVAHELGHNFGSRHTHDGYEPPIDRCGDGDCSEAWGGTIMSYCHHCDGGVANLRLAFHPRVVAQMTSFLDGACDIDGAELAFAYDDRALTLVSSPTRIDVLANDAPINCSAVGLEAVQSQTAAGGIAVISEGSGAEGRDEILYRPPFGYEGPDLFSYVMVTEDGASAEASVEVDVVGVREPDGVGGSRPGVAVDYFELPEDVESLPDFGDLSRYANDLLAQINEPRGYGQFATSGRTELVGAVFRGAIEIPMRGHYTLSLESDDGSRLFVGDELLIDNDGVHTMTERSAAIGLAPGFHRVRVEYFEQRRAQGLILRIEGPGVPRQVVPASSWRTDSCIADWDLDGEVDTADFLAFLSAWSASDAAADLDVSGDVDTADLNVFLVAWARGC